MKLRTDPDILNYILTVFPPEIEALEQLAQSLREQNSAKFEGAVADVEPVLVTAMWMRRVFLLDRYCHVYGRPFLRQSSGSSGATRCPR